MEEGRQKKMLWMRDGGRKKLLVGGRREAFIGVEEGAGD
jgi:hypothetical protein